MVPGWLAAMLATTQLLLGTAPAAGAKDANVCVDPNGYKVCVARNVSSVVGGSATLPCTFDFPASERPLSIDVAWRIDGFHGPFIFNSTNKPTAINQLSDSRLSLVGNPTEHSASLQIRNVIRSDQSTYFCRIILRTAAKPVEFQSIQGTYLMVKEGPAPRTWPTTSAELSTQLTATPSREYTFQTIPVAVSAALVGALLVGVCVVGLIVLVRRRSSSNQRSSACTVEPREGAADTVDHVEVPHFHQAPHDEHDEEVVYSRVQVGWNPKQPLAPRAPDEDSVVYAPIRV